jgi:hypothetical protein
MAESFFLLPENSAPIEKLGKRLAGWDVIVY